MVEKKFPVSLRPFQPVTVFVSCDSMETDAMPGDEVEFFAQIRQRGLRADSSYDAINAEKIGRAAEERLVIGIESETFVSEQLAEIKEITRAAAKIQDLERRRAIEPEILEALHVNANPVIGVFVGVDLSGVGPIGILLAQSYQLRSINRAENSSRTYGMRPATGVLPQAFGCVAGKEFLEFPRESHLETMQEKCAFLKERRLGKPSLLDFYLHQTGGALACHESVSPAVSWIEELFVAPKQLQVCAGRFLPSDFIVDVPFP